MRKENAQAIETSILEGMTSIRALIEAMDRGISDRRIEKILLDEPQTISGELEA